jgi:hypothetical protein
MQDGYTGLRGSVIKMVFVCTEAKKLTTVLYAIGFPIVKFQGAWRDASCPTGSVFCREGSCSERQDKGKHCQGASLVHSFSAGLRVSLSARRAGGRMHRERVALAENYEEVEFPRMGRLRFTDEIVAALQATQHIASNDKKE